jgi:hypothetical protein
MAEKCCYNNFKKSDHASRPIKSNNGKGHHLRSKTSLNYWMMVDKYSNLKEKLCGSNPDCEISSLR